MTAMFGLTLPRLVIAIGVFLSIAMIAWMVFLRSRRETYTRERFAFACLAAWFGLATSIIGSVAHKESLWDSIMGLVTHSPKPEPLRTSDQVFMFAILAAAAYVVTILHRNWSGAISIHQFERQRFQRPSTLLREGYDEARRIVRRQSYFTHYNNRDVFVPEPAIASSQTSLAWHIQARDLFCLRNHALDLNPESDWHMDAKCWLGRNRQTQRALAIHCVDASSPVEIEGFITYVKQIARTNKSNIRDFDFIVATRDASQKHQATIMDVQVQYITEAVLLDELVDFGDYFANIKTRVTKVPLPDSALTINDVYVPALAKTENGAKISGTLVFTCNI